LIVILVNGGQNALRTVYEATMRKCPVLVMQGTGRIVDALAFRIKQKRQRFGKHHHPVQQDTSNPWDELFPPGKPGTNEAETMLSQIFDNDQYITLFDVCGI